MSVSSRTIEPAVRRVGPFVLHTLLGRGGGGEAWAGVHEPTGTEVVVKRSLQGSLVSAERLDREIAHTCQVDHPHLVRVLDARRHTTRRGADGTTQTRDEPYLVVARALRGTLADHAAGLAAHPAALATALFDALAGLGHLHGRGFLHLDVKPANLFVHDAYDAAEARALHDAGGAGAPRRGALVQLGDLGASLPRFRAAIPRAASRLRAESGSDSPSVALMGTQGFLAPEHRSGDLARLGPWTDLWSLGATAWRLAGQTTSFAELGGPDGGDAAPSLPPEWGWLLAWCRRCAMREPEARFATARAAADGLLALGQPGDRELLSRVTAGPISSVSLARRVSMSREVSVGAAIEPTVTASFVAMIDDTGDDRDEGRDEARDDLASAERAGGGAVGSCAPDTTARGRGAPLDEDTARDARDSEAASAGAGAGAGAGAEMDSPDARELPLGLGAGAAAVRRPPLVGRQRIRRRLAELWRRACASRGGEILVLEGPPGVGLTRLAEWAGETAHERDGAAVIGVAMGEGRGGLPETLRRWILGAGFGAPGGGTSTGVNASASPLELAAHVRARLQAEGLWAVATRATLDALVDGFTALLEGRRRSAPQLAALFEQLVRVLRTTRPVVVVVDGLDSARTTTPLTWLEHAASQLTRAVAAEGESLHGALLIVTQAGPLGPGAGFASLRLEPEVAAQVVVEPIPPLLRFDTERLASRLLGFSDHTSQAIAARSQGLPAHLVAHVATWLQEGVLQTGPTGLSLVLAEGQEPPAPPSITSAARARLGRVLGLSALDGPLGLTIATASLFDLDDAYIGEAVDEVRARLQLPPLPLDALHKAGLVLSASVPEEGGRLGWTLPGLGDQLLADHPDAKRVYRVCAEALERAGPAPGYASLGAEPPPWDACRGLALARWFGRAGEPSQALAAMARICGVDLDPDTARGVLELLERLHGASFEDGERGLIAALCARMSFERGDHERARHDAARARSLLGEPGEADAKVIALPNDLRVAGRLHALHVLALIEATEGGPAHAEQALAMGAEAERCAEQGGPDASLTARSLVARLLIITSRSVEAIAVMERAIADGASAAAAAPIQWRAWILLADACTNAGFPDRALPWIARAVDAMTESGGHWMLGQAQNTLADGLMRQRRFDEALVPLRAALAEFYPRTPTAGYVRANMAFCCLCLGRMSEARGWVDEGLARLATGARHRLWCLLQSLRLPLLVDRGDRDGLEHTIGLLESWLSTQRMMFTEPAEAATLAAEGLEQGDTATRQRLFSLARRLAEHVEDASLHERLAPRWTAE